MKRKDGRKNNGGKPTPNGEDSQLVRGPKELLEAMRAEAKRLEISVAALWRRAARLILLRQP